jgi:hypothetical protein
MSSTTIFTRIPLTDKEAEGLMWGFAQIGDHAERTGVTDPADPLFTLLKEGYQPAAITACCEGLFEHAYANCLTEPFTDLEKLILRLSVENSSWVWHYKEHFPDETTMIRQARGALRTLAEKLELLGIDINILPAD